MMNPGPTPLRKRRPMQGMALDTRFRGDKE